MECKKCRQARRSSTDSDGTGCRPRCSASVCTIRHRGAPHSYPILFFQEKLETSPARTREYPAMNSIPVRKLFWEELELALETQTHRLVRDIANVLGQPPDPLLKALRDERVSAYLYDEPADQDIDLSEMRCKELTLKASGAFVAACGHPVVWSSHPGGRRVCFQHSVPCPKPATAGLPPVTLYTVDKTAYYITEDGSVFNDAGDIVGRYSDSVLQLFHVDTE